MIKVQEVEYISISNNIDFKYIKDCYSVIEEYDINDCIIIYKMFAKSFEDEIKKYKGKAVKDIKDIYSLDNPDSIIIKNFIKEKLKFSVDSILISLVNYDINSLSDIRIPGCFTIIDNGRLIIGSTKYRLFSIDDQSVGYANISMLKKFVLSKVK